MRPRAYAVVRSARSLSQSRAAMCRIGSPPIRGECTGPARATTWHGVAYPRRRTPKDNTFVGPVWPYNVEAAVTTGNEMNP
jgi:hypothetical protein